jgi:alkylation response protein AidB-like acyl-CoA dehydrogenase
MFASMIDAADYVMVLVFPDTATASTAGMLALIPSGAEGRRVIANWDTLGMRATRSDSLILEDCWVPDDSVIYRSDDIRSFRNNGLNWFWGSYTAVYLGLAVAAYDELRGVVAARRPEGYAQSLAWHPDVRRHIAELSVELEAARLITYRSAWLRDQRGPSAEATAAMYRAKYIVGQTVSHITRVALTLGGAHGIFKGSRLEQLFRDGALAEIQPPPSDFCLWNVGLHELNLDPADVMPPMRPAS